MGTSRPLFLVSTLSLALSCALLTRSYRPPHAPKAEADQVNFHWGPPKERIILSGAWLRATAMALDDFLPAEDAESARGEGEESLCLAQRDNYVVWAWGQPNAKLGGADGGSSESDGGMGLEEDGGSNTDSGYDSAFDQPGMRPTPSIIYVSIFLLPGRCEVDGSPLMDMGATYAIDTVRWRIFAIHH
jgi:hypothetical protein